MENEFYLRKQYEMLGYKDLGCVNTNQKAYDAVQKSTNKQWFQIRKNLHFVVCHDLFIFATIDSGD